MKITYISNSPIPSRTANSMHVMKMCQAFRRNGHDVCLTALAGPDPRSGIWDQYGITNQFHIEWLVRRNWAKGIDYALNSGLLARRRMSDLVYTRDFTAAAVCSMLRLPTILEVHTPEMTRLARLSFHRFLGKKSCKGVVLISEALKKNRLSYWGKRFESCKPFVIPDGVDLALFSRIVAPEEARKELGLNSRFTVGYSGHLYKGRGIEMILRIAGRLPDIQFLIAGGAEKDIAHYKAEVAAKSLTNVVFAGFIPNVRLPRYLFASDILVLPYEKEVRSSSGQEISSWMSPLKMFEYLASGRPIIASDLPVLREVLEENCCAFCDPGDAESWVKQIRELMQMPDKTKQMGDAGRNKSQAYSWEKRASTILEQCQI